MIPIHDFNRSLFTSLKFNLKKSTVSKNDYFILLYYSESEIL